GMTIELLTPGRIPEGSRSNEFRNNPSWCYFADAIALLRNIHVARGIESYSEGRAKTSTCGWPTISVPILPNLPVPSDNGCNTRCHFNHDMVIYVANVEVTTPKSEPRQAPQACASSRPAVAKKSGARPHCGRAGGGSSHGEHELVAVATAVTTGKAVR